MAYLRSFLKETGGLNKTERRERKIIVSITSYPGRIRSVPYTIMSMLRQTVKADKIILWLGEDRFPSRKLPGIFRKLKECGLEVEYRKDIGPHTKYFYAMQEYPDDIVITVDDDHIYGSNLIETLYRSYLENPDCVSPMRAIKLAFMPDGNIEKFRNWNGPQHYLGASHQYMATGVGGVLYPPHSLHEEAFNLDAMQRLCPKDDDVWLKVMEAMKGTKVLYSLKKNVVNGVNRKLIFGSQREALHRYNIGKGGGDIQTEAIINAYNHYLPDGRTLLEIMNEGI